MAQKITLTLAALSLFFLSSLAEAKIMQIPTFDLTRFQQKAEFTVSGITTPKVVTYETLQRLGDFVALQNTGNKDFISFSQTQKSESNFWQFPVESTSELIDGNTRFVQDQNQSSFITFDSAQSTHSLTFSNPRWLMPSKLNFSLAANTTAPKTVSIQVILAGSKDWKTIVDKKPFSSSITFPQIQPRQIRVVFESSNLLRLAELEFTTTNRQSTTKQQISFYASEGDNFTLWMQPAFGQKRISTTQNTPSRAEPSAPVFDLPQARKNPVFNNDFDRDGIMDQKDLCPKIADPENSDKDKNGKGDVCEDPDQDGYMSLMDNCPFKYNPGQSDLDVDGLGDLCDMTEDRSSEQSTLWINLSFGAMILLLLFLIGRSALKSAREKKK